MIEHLGNTTAQRLTIASAIFAVMGGGMAFVPDFAFKVGDIEVSGTNSWKGCLIVALALLVGAILSWLMNRDKGPGFIFAINDVEEGKPPVQVSALSVPDIQVSKEMDALEKYVGKTEVSEHLELLLLFVRNGRTLNLNNSAAGNYIRAGNQLEGLDLISSGMGKYGGTTFTISKEKYTYLFDNQLVLFRKLKKLNTPKDYGLCARSSMSTERFDELVALFLKSEIDHFIDDRGNVIIRYSSEVELVKATKIYSDFLNSKKR